MGGEILLNIISPDDALIVRNIYSDSLIAYSAKRTQVSLLFL